MDTSNNLTKGRLAATSVRFAPMGLTWDDGTWGGDPVMVAQAEVFYGSGKPVLYTPGFRLITPEDGAAVYAIAVMKLVLGAFTWDLMPPAGFDDYLLGEWLEEDIH